MQAGSTPCVETQGTDVVAAAGLPIAFGTSHVALLHRCRLRAGQTVLVLGAAGGVGLAAVQARIPALVNSSV